MNQTKRIGKVVLIVVVLLGGWGCAKTSHNRYPQRRVGRSRGRYSNDMCGRAPREMVAVKSMSSSSVRPSPRHRRLLESRPQRLVMGGKSRRPLKPVAQNRNHNTETYDRVYDNRFLAAKQNRLSTFSIDVDTASYANVRRFLTHNQKPPAGAVRIEELVNYFSYKYDAPKGKVPFSVHVEVAQAPWKNKHRLVRIGLKGKVVDNAKRPASNLVFLLDVSGSMRYGNKLPLLKKAINLLVQNLDERDTVSIVVYAGGAGMVLPPTSGQDKSTILTALNRLNAGGSTNGGAGIKLAYKLAVSRFIKGGINRVILATDGDFNVGTTNRSELLRLIEKKAKSGVYLTILGLGMGNYKDATLEKLSNKGNGNYAYIDSMKEAKKVFVDGMAGTLMTIAKDVKIQVEFNPSQVRAYRLIGYENRMLKKEDFNDDKKDSGDMGAGHTVTALYEVVPVGVKSDVITGKVDPLRYGKGTQTARGSKTSEMLYVKLRYKQPDGNKSKLLTLSVKDKGRSFKSASVDFRFAAAVAAFGMLLRGSKYKGSATFGQVAEWAKPSLEKKNDPKGYRSQFLKLVSSAGRLYGEKTGKAQQVAASPE